MSPQANPTLKQIAARAGLTVSGVSLAMRNHPSIPRNTCIRVQEAARELGYRPDPELSRLMTYLRRHPLDRTNGVLGLLTLHNVHSFWKANNYLKRLYEALVKRAAELGYETHEFWLKDPTLSLKRTRQILSSRGIKALIIVDGPTLVQRLDFDFSKFSTVAIGYGITLPLHRVCQHQYQEMFRLLDQLGRLGYQRPGLVLSEEIDERTQFHYSAAYTIYHRGAKRIPSMLIRKNVTHKSFGHWLARHKPDVIIASNPISPLLDWLRLSGHRIPADIGFVSLDVDPISHPHLAGILQNYERVASVAVELLVSNVKHGDLGIPASPNVMLVEGRWNQGTSVRGPA